MPPQHSTQHTVAVLDASLHALLHAPLHTLFQTLLHPLLAALRQTFLQPFCHATFHASGLGQSLHTRHIRHRLLRFDSYYVFQKGLLQGRRQFQQIEHREHVGPFVAIGVHQTQQRRLAQMAVAVGWACRRLKLCQQHKGKRVGAGRRFKFDLMRSP